ncbi:8-amino-7-oxononanoate synthase [Teredinibacter waterburyi]|uniref:8-amino-7-oxononanoate synthase n=1 Tax=Teredinibacter waterburyi TaxID=1500538 RepID=UPI00165F576C|nr:8-amino-7-oxononanoate synthase [Teredinibacter waterburyi]
MNLDQILQARLQQRRELNLYRSRKTVQSPQATHIKVDGKALLNFCSNDYLGLANHPDVTARLKQAADNFGVGSGASHLVNGHTAEHHALEQELAAFTGRERALLFSTGYMANMGVINALVGKGDFILQDKLNHASLIDGGLLSSAASARFNHGDMQHLQQRLASSQSGQRLIATDGVFSMDGDLAKLPELASMSERHDAWLLVDDAHGFGCIGEQGRGSVSHFGLDQNAVPVLIGTLGKAFGTFGAFVAGSEALIESLIQFSRTYIYTTAMPAAIAAATRCSLELLIAGDQRRQHLNDLISQFRQGCSRLGLTLMDSASPIQPVLVGDAQQAINMSQFLMDKSCWVSAIRPPTVPKNTARLRVTLTASHTSEQVDQLLSAFAYALERMSSTQIVGADKPQNSD